MDKTEHTDKIKAELLKKYFNRQCKGEECGEVLKYFLNYSYENELKKHLYDQWNKLPDEPEDAEEIDSGRILAGIYRRINTEEQKEIPTVRKIFNAFSKAAAVLIIPLMIYAIWHISNDISDTSDSKTSYAEIYAPLGARTHFELPDGTHGWLNSGSILKFPVEFSKRSRKVFLSGECYFDVVKDKKRPFSVKVKDIEVEVLGTKFNVLGYNEDKTIDVTLESGKVVINKAYKNNKIRVTELDPDQQVKYYIRENKFKKRKVDTHNYTSWKQGLLIFRDEPMESLITRLERWYNVEIVLKDDKIKEYRYRATFEDETIDEVLNFMKLTSPIEYKICKREKKADGTFTKKKIEISLRTDYKNK